MRNFFYCDKCRLSITKKNVKQVEVNKETELEWVIDKEMSCKKRVKRIITYWHWCCPECNYLLDKKRSKKEKILKIEALTHTFEHEINNFVSISESAFQNTLKLDKKISDNKNNVDLLKKRVTNNEKLNAINFNLHYKPTETITKVQVKKHQDYKDDQNKKKIKKASKETIYQPIWELNDNKYPKYPKLLAGWISFAILAPSSIVYWYKLKNKKRKINNSLDEIRDRFESWRFSIFSTLVLFITLFFLSQQAITALRPKIGEWKELYRSLVFFVTALILGGLAIADGFISSNLKTNLQRLSFNIQDSVTDKDLKKGLFFLSQEATETLKENFKRFGMLAIPTLILRALDNEFEKHPLSNAYYFIPVVYAGMRIYEVERLLKKLKLKNYE